VPFTGLFPPFNQFQTNSGHFTQLGMRIQAKTDCHPLSPMAVLAL
jgi:hypothetical protein